MEKLTYSVNELAEVLGVGRNVAYTLVQRADFPAIRLGGRRVVVPIEGLKRWLEGQTQDSIHVTPEPVRGAIRRIG